MKKTFIILIISSLGLDIIAQSSTILPSAVELPKFSTNPTCTNSEKGRLIFNTTHNRSYYCNGTTWVDMSAGGLTLPYSGSGNFNITSNFNIGIAIRGESNAGIGVFGVTDSGNGLWGESISGNAVRAESVSGEAVRAFSGSGTAVYGNSNSGYGIYGESTNSYAGFFLGKARITSFLEVYDRIGINTVNVPSDVSLHIKGKNDGTWNQGIKLESPISTDYGGLLYDNDGLKFRTFGANDEFFFRDNGNNTRVRFSATGNIYLDGTVFPNSDSRLKRNIQPVSYSLANLQKLKGYNYYWKEAKTNNDLQTGLIAQEVQAIFPELVATDEDGMLSVNYMGLIPHLVEAVKDLKKENDDLKKRLDKIEKLLK